MGHHHRKHNSKAKGNERVDDKRNSNSNQNQNTLSNSNSNVDLGAMLQNLNLNDVDLSKIDMNKVQSIMNKMSGSSTTQSGNTNSDNENSFDSMSSILRDPRIFLLNSIKGSLPRKKAKKIEKITKFLQMTNAMNTKR